MLGGYYFTGTIHDNRTYIGHDVTWTYYLYFITLRAQIVDDLRLSTSCLSSLREFGLA